MSQNIIGDRLRKLRKDKNVTLQCIGDKIGATRFTIGNIERGDKQPSLIMIIALADYFDVSVDYLLGRTDNPSVNK